MKTFLKFILSLFLLITFSYASSQVPGTSGNDEESVNRLLGREISGIQVFKIFEGHYGLSTDGYGGKDNEDGNISAYIPSGSTVVAAYLYAAGVGSGGQVYNVEFDGTLVEYNETTDIWSGEGYYTGRKDITSLVNHSILMGACDDSGLCNFDIKELGYNDGEALVVVYENSSLPESTIAILDGHAKMSGDTTILNLSEPIDKEKEGFFAHMYLGISYSYDLPDDYYQTSKVDVNGKTLTTVAGAQDDGYASNGGLITVGSFDDPFTPETNVTGESDHEKYNLTPFLEDGDNEIKVDTYNSSQDDNVFLVIFHISQKTDNVYIDGGPIVTGPKEVIVKKGSTVTLEYTVKNSANAPIDINLSLDNSSSHFADDVAVNSQYDVNETKIVNVIVQTDPNYSGDSMEVKLNALGNNINAYASTIIRFDSDELFGNIKLREGWNLLGASRDITVDEVVSALDKKGFDTKVVFKYIDLGWAVYIVDNSRYTNSDLPVFNAINKEEGFWVYIKNKK